MERRRLASIVSSWHCETSLMEELYDVVVLAISISLGIFAWRDVFGNPLPDGPMARFRLLSTTALSCNILLFCGLYFVDLAFNPKHPPSQATLGEYKAMVAVLLVTRLAIILSLLTLVFAALSAKGLARKLCFWGSSAGVCFWVFAHFAETEILSVYSTFHAG